MYEVGGADDVLVVTFFFFFKSSGGWVKIKLKLPYFHVWWWCSRRRRRRLPTVVLDSPSCGVLARFFGAGGGRGGECNNGRKEPYRTAPARDRRGERPEHPSQDAEGRVIDAANLRVYSLIPRK